MNFPFAPEQASNFAYQHDVIFYALLILTILFTVLVGFLVIYFAVKYRRGAKVDRSRPHHENMPLEITWSVIPLVLGIIMFFFGAKLFIEMRTPPANAQEIFMIGKQWMWHAQHYNGVREQNTLHVPVGKPVKITMISQDVLHALYIPDFRVQFHVVPGRYTQVWFTATKAGRFPLFCAMYCGTQHSEMGGYVYAMEAGEYADWLKNGGQNVAQLSMEGRGAKLYEVVGCTKNCHQPKDTPNAPSLVGIYGTQRTAGGTGVKVDEAYLRESILRPYDRLTAGYRDTMPVYQNQLSEEDVLDLIAFLKNHNGAGASSSYEPEEGAQTGEVVQSANQKPLAVGALAEKNPGEGETQMERTGAAVGAVAAEERARTRPK